MRNYLSMGILLGAFAGAAFVQSAAQSVAQSTAKPTRSDAEKDPVLKAMLAEMDRSKAELQLKDFSRPFFLQYRIEEMDHFETRAAFGASEGSFRQKLRVARVLVRVGDCKSDSSGNAGEGAQDLAVVDDDPVALRSVLWSATDQAYKTALAEYARKQAELKQVQTPPQSDDFSRETPMIFLAPNAKLNIEEKAWVERVALNSGIYRTEPALQELQKQIEDAHDSFHARATTTWIVNSEGTIVRKPSMEFQETFFANTQAEDGMLLTRSYDTTATSEADLDAENLFHRHVVERLTALADLRKAPIVEEEYHGPVLLSADAAADTLGALLGRAVLGTRPQLGTEARTNGAFASSLHARVLPESFDVVDDPRVKSWNGKGLSGAYDVDDEGVPAQTVALITAGKLENYLMSRQPIRDFPQSNGHGRVTRNAASHAALGVLKIESREGLSDDELQRRLLSMAQDRGLKSVYYVDTLGGVNVPRMIYRVSNDGTPAGKRELVRGAELHDLDLRALRSNVAAAGKELFAANTASDAPHTVLAPALLMEEITVRRANAKNDKLPFYPAPE